MKGAKKKKYNKRYYADNKQNISERKKEVYWKNIETSHLETAACKKDDNNMNLKRNCLKNATHMKRRYNNDIMKSRAENAARTKKYYENNSELNCAHMRQR